ncbi:high-affinity Cu transporter CTR1 Ecym_1253 [Eremothecium cymbalariae DBVPG|uniref:Copper transport protein n=1 Tax=Eremothecium cymbalariae (strain CBS 270.75 / DBVPG 7215 / KCTC 17166 / NRRL Y-17582) TaxID=931890 RepID=G8JN31_ERECY|nr:hypothetical protein Ecym_1253 [Eremothecium cymbalariae DBVPG\
MESSIGSLVNISSLLDSTMLRHHDMDTSSTPTMSASSTMAAHSGSHSSESATSGHGHMMMMNSYLTTSYKHYPVLFKNLTAGNGGEALGIFLLIVATAFAYKSLLFASWCLEVKWFKTVDSTPASAAPIRGGSGLKNVHNGDATVGGDKESQYNRIIPPLHHLVFDIFSPTWRDLGQDLIRLLLTAASTLLVYMLMLIAMTYVAAYIFAVVVGLALAEVFFNRVKIILLRRWDLKREIERRKNCPGGLSCSCGFHENDTRSFPEGITEIGSNDLDSGSITKDVSIVRKNNVANEKSCCCGPADPVEQEERHEREATELSKHREQGGSMNVDLMPAEKFM